MPTGVHDPAVDVKLMLIGGRVGSPHGEASPIAGYAPDLALGVARRAIEGVEHPHSWEREPARDLQPAQEGLGLLRATGGQEGARADAGVTRPGVAIVPVEISAHPLGQGGGRSCERGTRGRVGQLPERDQAPDHRLPK